MALSDHEHFASQRETLRAQIAEGVASEGRGELRDGDDAIAAMRRRIVPHASPFDSAATPPGGRVHGQCGYRCPRLFASFPSEIMRAEGHDVRIGYDGQGGLQLARERIPDIAQVMALVGRALAECVAPHPQPRTSAP